MTVKTLVFDRNGKARVEIEPSIEFITWRLNNTGKATFYMPYTDPKCTPSNLAYGNRVLFQFDNGLPDWGGVIDTPRKRTYAGVEVAVYTGEKLLDWRVTDKARYFTSQNPGYIFQTLLEEESAIVPIGITAGYVYSGGDARTLEYHFHDLLKRYTDLAKLTGMDFAILPVYSSGHLSFTASWYSARGIDRSARVQLIENINCSEVVLDEQGQIANAIHLAGAGDTWGSGRITSETEDTTSINAYGYREWAEIQIGVSEQATLDANAAQLLTDMKNPQTGYSIGRALNVKPALYSDYDIGDTIKLKALLKSGAWQPVDTTVRVIARQWQPDDTVVLEVR